MASSRKNNSFGDLERILKELEKQGCSCDLMYGVVCSIHSLVRDGFLTIVNMKKRMGVNPA